MRDERLRFLSIISYDLNSISLSIKDYGSCGSNLFHFVIL
jgi:hypothetical protein